MDFTIKPYVGVGPLRFGMSSEEIRRLLQAKGEPVEKGSSSGIPADFFLELGIFIFYRQPGLCEAVEFGGPVSPTLSGKHLLGLSFKEAESWTRGIDRDVVIDEAGLKTFKFGCALYAPSAAERPDLPVAGVMVFEKGYYERYASTSESV